MGGQYLNNLKFKLTTRDNIKLQAEFTKDETQPVKGVVIIIHGFGEHIRGYRDLASFLAKSGYANFVFDQRGHGDLREYGKLEKMQGIIPSYQAFLDDIELMTEQADNMVPGVPISLYGHSMGGNIILSYLIRLGWEDYKCVILESPWFGLFKELHPVVNRIAKILGFLSPKIAIYNELPPDKITGKADNKEDYDDDPFYHNRISLRMYAGVKNGCEYILKNASKVSIPIYLAYGKHDQIVCNNAIMQFTNKNDSNVKAKEYDAYHAIRKGSKRDEFFHDVVTYLDEQ